MPEHSKMKVIRRASITEPYHVTRNVPVPEVPQGGARVKVLYAGVCYTDKQVARSGQKRPRMKSIADTSLFPGYEVSGIIEAVCNTVEESTFKVGDKVIVFPADECCDEQGFAEYIIVQDIRNLVHIPDSLPMQVAAMLPTGALTAMAAIERTKHFVKRTIQEKEMSGGGVLNVLIVGAGALGLWTIILGRYMHRHLEEDKINIVVADTNLDKLTVAKEHGCSAVTHWDDSQHEEYIVARTKCACHGPVDLVIDFVSSPRTINRSMQVLAKGGILVVGGNAQYEISFCLRSLAQNEQCIMGVGKGTRDQLTQLVDLVATEQVKVPMHQLFPVEDANTVISQLEDCTIQGRAVFEVCSPGADERR